VSAEFEKLLPILTEAGVEFIMIGGVAGVVHGSARATYDVDVLYSRTKENIQRLADALAPHEPSLRDTPADLPFTWNARTIHSGLNFTLTTKLGDGRPFRGSHRRRNLQRFAAAFVRSRSFRCAV